MSFFDFLKNNKFIIILVSIILNILLVILSIYLFIIYNNYECICDNKVSNYEENTYNETEEFYVEVKGEVKKPGVYQLNNSNIINDLINAAGGFTKNAYTKNINLSKKISNELVVYVYSTSEYKNLQKEKIVYITKEIPCESNDYDISNCTENAKSEIISSEKETVYNNDNSDITSNTTNENISNTSLININTANIDELQTLSGIGKSKAEDIITYRNTNGLFKSIQEIQNVKGIGTSIYEKIKDNITV